MTEDDVDALLAHPERLTVVFQPIVDLRRGVVAGYEALSRIDGGAGAPPDVWFAAAGRAGRGAELEALALGRALAVRPTLPANTFLTVNLSPAMLDSGVVVQVLRAAGDLRGVVVELTEHDHVDEEDLSALLVPLRALGASVAVDDAGSGYSGLQRLVAVRPQLVKLDRALVARADRDEVKLAMAESLGNLAGRLDAWLLVEGVERQEELEAFVRLGVPLGQGWLLGRPAPPWAHLAEPVSARIRALAARATLVEQVASLVEQVPALRPADHARSQELLVAEPDADAVVLLDDAGKPVRLVLATRRAGDPPGGVRAETAGLRVLLSDDVRAVARRAMTRSAGERFDPLLCTDGQGRLVGVVRVERLLLRLADLK